MKRIVGLVLCVVLLVALSACSTLGAPRTPSPAIAAGYLHALALKSDGSVWTWGENNFGQLGDGTTINRDAPVPVSGVSNVIAIAGGSFFSMVLESGGSVWAWGDNRYDQLGDGTTTGSSTPVQVSGLANVKAIATTAGSLFSLALKSDGSVRAWGTNDDGELGNGTTIASSTPVQVLGPGGTGPLTGVVAISVGSGFWLALKSDGSVWAWGYNADGELGNDSTKSSSTPVQVSSLSNVTAIAGAYHHSLALESDGSLWAWGYNTDGELGDGNTSNSTVPVQVTSLGDVVAIGPGGYHSLALERDGSIWAWGANYNGSLGDGTTTSTSTPVQVLGPGGSGTLSGVIALSAGSGFSLALKSDGSVWAWGGGGQLGDGTTTTSSTPVQVLNLP